METRHTPGPWQENYTPHQIGIFAPAASRSICSIFLPVADYEAEEANARLIAAAPDLLAALEEIARAKTTTGADTNVKTIWAIVKRAEEAITKATSS